MIIDNRGYESGRFPRVYHASRGWLALLVGCGLVLLLGGLAGIWLFTTQPIRQSSSRSWIVALFCAFALLGLYGILSTLRSKIVIFDDRIEVVGLIRTRAMARKNIRGWRSLPTSPPQFVLVPSKPGSHSLKFTQIFRPDAEFAEWLLNLPCLDRDDERASKIEIRNNPNLGATPGQRMRTLARGRRLATLLFIVGGVACLWTFVYPRPYEWLILVLALLPWIAIAIVNKSHGLFRVDGYRNDTHPNVAFTIIFPALVLLLRSTDFEIVYSSTIIWLSAALAVLLMFGVLKADATLRARPGSIVALLVFSLVYGYGTTIEANVLLDGQPGDIYSTPVIERRAVRGKTTRYEVRVGPWGPKTAPNNIRVERMTFDYIRAGNVVNVVLKHGAVGVKWYYLLSWGTDPADRNRRSIKAN